MERYLNAPLKQEDIKSLKAGDYVYISGTIYTARDAAHKRMVEDYEKGISLPFEIKDAIIYYCGATPAAEGKVIGSAGPTTSGRMDKYTPLLLDLGLGAMIGKGTRSEEVYRCMNKNNSVYFLAIGGAGALISKSVVSSKIIAYEDLGTEAIMQLEVNDFFAVVS